MGHEAFDLISSRAVTNTKLLLELTSKISDGDTEYLFYKGSRVFNEIEDVQHVIRMPLLKRVLL